MNSMSKKLNKWKNYSFGDKMFLIITYLLLALIAFVCLYPLYFTILASFSDPHAVSRGEVTWWIKEFTTEAYDLVFQNRQIWRGYANTIFYTVVGTAFNLFLTVPAAYALSKKKMFGRSFLMTLFIITMYFSGGMIPTYILFKNLHLINTPWIMIISGGLSVYNLVVTRTYFQNNIPETLYEAARIDGSSEFRIFFELVIPLSAPILAVIGLYYAVAHWSSYFNAMIYISDVDLYPLQVILRKILILNEAAYENILELGDLDLIEDLERQSQLAITMKYALVFIASAPMLVAYPFIQKHFVKGMMIGSLKG